MIAWDVLTANSSLSDGDAWEHLNAQEGGGEIVVNVANGIRSAMNKIEVYASLETLAASVEISVITGTVTIEDVGNV